MIALNLLFYIKSWALVEIYLIKIFYKTVLKILNAFKLKMAVFK